MVNNYKQIVPLLKWEEGYFYFIQILQRKKDHKEGTKVNGTNNNARLVKAYYVDNPEYLEFIMPEIIQLCEIFNARAGINLNRRRYSTIQIKFAKKILDQMENGTIDKAYKAYPSVVGANSHEPRATKTWIVDVDEDEMIFLNEIKHAIMLATDGGSGSYNEIPSKTGLHLIVRPFNRSKFPEYLNSIMEKYQVKLKLDIQSNNPTNLYIP